MCTRMIATTAAAAVAAAALFSPATASAQTPAYVAPGAPMRVFPANPPATDTDKNGQEVKVPPAYWMATCSQGPVGTVRLPDGTLQHVMLTAAHCVDTLPGAPQKSNEVKVPVDTGYERIGTVSKSSNVPPASLDLSDIPLTVRSADWAVMLVDDGVGTSNLAQSRDYAGAWQGDPVAITSIRDFRTLAPGEVSVDNFGQPVCKDGATTGRTCGTQLARTRNGVYSTGLHSTYGDSGGINYDPRDGAALGVMSIALSVGPVDLYKIAPADRIIEDAYGVPDGHVNEVFTPAESAPRAEFIPYHLEVAYVDQQVEKDNPDHTPPKPVDPRQELNKAVGKAQQDAHEVASSARQGQFDSEKAAQLAQENAFNLTQWAVATVVSGR